MISRLSRKKAGSGLEEPPAANVPAQTKQRRPSNQRSPTSDEHNQTDADGDEGGSDKLGLGPLSRPDTRPQQQNAGWISGLIRRGTSPRSQPSSSRTQEVLSGGQPSTSGTEQKTMTPPMTEDSETVESHSQVGKVKEAAVSPNAPSTQSSMIANNTPSTGANEVRPIDEVSNSLNGRMQFFSHVGSGHLSGVPNNKSQTNGKDRDALEWIEVDSTSEALQDKLNETARSRTTHGSHQTSTKTFATAYNMPSIGVDEEHKTSEKSVRTRPDANSQTPPPPTMKAEEQGRDGRSDAPNEPVRVDPHPETSAPPHLQVGANLPSHSYDTKGQGPLVGEEHTIASLNIVDPTSFGKDTADQNVGVRGTEPSAGPAVQPLSRLPEVMPTSEESQTRPEPDDDEAKTDSLIEDSTTVKVDDLSNKEDVVIAVMGPTGSGKSTFISTASGLDADGIGHSLKSCTSEVLTIKFFDEESRRNVVLVDTPGFDDTYKSDLDILTMISKWLNSSYSKKKLLSGILYLHRITDNRMAGTPLKNLRVFQKLCGNNALDKVYLTTTMWDEVDEEIGEKRLEELCAEYWKPMIDCGARIARCKSGADPPKKLISDIIFHDEQRKALQLQREMGEGNRELKETAAGQQLFSHLEQLVKKQSELLQKIAKERKAAASNPVLLKDLQQEYNELREQIDAKLNQVQQLKLSWFKNLRRKFKR